MNEKIKKQILSLINLSDAKWNLFNPKESYLLAISGGKDSLSLLTLLSNFLKNFKCLHIQISPDSDLSFIPFVKNYSTIDIISSNIMEQAITSKKNPCFICSRRRNQAIFEYAHSKGIQKVIFAHNREDVTETLLMNMLYSRKIATMLPKQDLFGGKIHVIRPLYEVPEILLANYAKEIPTITKACQFDGHTKRQYIKDLIKQISQDHPQIKIADNLYNSLLHVDSLHLPNLINRKE